MAHDADTGAGPLERMLELSIRQLELLKEKRFVELLGCQQERDALVAALDTADPGALRADKRLGKLAARIMENDRLIRLNASTTRAELNDRLCRFGKSKKAIKAYTKS